MRKSVIVICGVLIVYIIGIVVMSQLKTNEADFNPADKVTMEIVEGTLTNTGATIVITDLSGEDNTYGAWYRIDKWEDGKWYELEDKIAGENAWIAIGYKTDENNQLQLDIGWEGLYGALESGKYRIVKDFSGENPYDDRHVASEFTIE